MTIDIELHHHVRKDGRQKIVIRITLNRKHKRYNSEIYIKNSEYKKNAKWGRWIKETHPEADKLNRLLEEKIIKIRDHYEKHQVINPEAAVRGDSFFSFANDFIEKYNNKDQFGTYKLYKSKLEKLKKYGGDKLTFRDINVEFLRNYVNHLKRNDNGINTIGTDLKKIKAIFNQAIREDIIEYRLNPFLKIKILSNKSKKERLTKDELQMIREVPLKKGGYLYHARNIFLFCINSMGMRIGDAMRLKAKNIVNGKLMYQMNKTGDVMSINLSTEAKAIVSSYKKKQLDDYIFPYIEPREDEFLAISRGTALVNKALKEIVGRTSIKKKVTTHVARHTYTQLAINSSANPRTIQKALGHSTFAITENYIRELDFNDVDALNEKMWG